MAERESADADGPATAVAVDGRPYSLRQVDSTLSSLWAASTVLFMVYNEIKDISAAGNGLADRNFIIEHSRVFDLFR